MNSNKEAFEQTLSLMKEHHATIISICEAEGSDEGSQLINKENEFRKEILNMFECMIASHINYEKKIASQQEEIKKLENITKVHRDEISILTDEMSDPNNNSHILNSIEGLVNDIREINLDYAQLKEQRSSQNITVNTAHEIKPPIFKAEGDNERPLKFLRDMKQYITSNNLNIERIKLVLSQNLQNKATSWWDITCNNINSWEDFETQFRERFWSDVKVRKLKEKLQFGRYNFRGSKSRMQYASDMLSLMNELEPEKSETERIGTLINHFDRSIQIAIIGREITKLSELNKILEQYDIVDSNFKKQSNNSNNSSYNNGTNVQSNSNNNNNMNNKSNNNNNANDNDNFNRRPGTNYRGRNYNNDYANNQNKTSNNNEELKNSNQKQYTNSQSQNKRNNGKKSTNNQSTSQNTYNLRPRPNANVQVVETTAQIHNSEKKDEIENGSSEGNE